MKYSIEKQSESGDDTVDFGLTKKQAIMKAREFAKKYPKINFYISWYRKTDDQHGYLNPSGDHDITGQAW